MGEDSPVADGEIAYLTPEAKARVEIDRMLAAQEIVEDLEAALAEFAAVAQSLGGPVEPPTP